MGDWIVRPIEGMLNGDLGPRHLQPKSMDVLVVLASSPNNIVERDELIEKVWGRTAVTDEPLTRCIHEIRRELSDTRDKPTYIQTIPKRGYRLIAPVEPVGEEVTLEFAATRTNSDGKTQSEPGEAIPEVGLMVQLIKRRIVWVGAIYALLAWALTRVAVYSRDAIVNDFGAPDWLLPLFMTALFLGFPVAVFVAWAYEVAESGSISRNRRITMFGPLFSRRGIDLVVITLVLGVLAVLAMDLRPPPAQVVAAGPESNRIAVLPFAVQGDGGKGEWLGNGIADDLLNLLTGVEDLEVASSTSSFRKFPETTDIRDIGHELEVHYVLSGTVQRDEDQLRVKAELLDAQTGYRLWSEHYDRQADDLFAIQQEIAREVVVTTKLAMPAEFAEQRAGLPGEQFPAFSPPTTSVKAYDYYLQARDILLRSMADDAPEQAAELFTQAIQYDAGFALAYAGLCTSLVQQINRNPTLEVSGLAAEVCGQAVELDPECADSRTAHADLYRATGQPAKAIDEYSLVVSQQPQAVAAHLGLAQAYADLDDIEKAEQAYLVAIELKPDHADVYREYSAFLFSLSRYREVVETGRRLIQLDPENIVGYNMLGDASIARGQFNTAIAAFQEVIKREPTSTAFSSLGTGYYYLGRYEAAIRMFNRAADMAPLEYRFWGELGDAYNQSGLQVNAEAAYRKARDLAESQHQIAPDDPATAIFLAYYCAAINDDGCASKYSADAVAMAPREAAVHYYSALVHLRLGREAAAIAAAERALALGYPRALFTVDPLLESVRNSPRLAGVAFGQRTLARNDGRNGRFIPIFP